MIVKEFDFSEDLINRTSDLIIESQILPERMLIVAPSKRFFQYLADRLFEINHGKSALLPDFITSDELVFGILSNLTTPMAGESEQLRMMIKAIKQSQGYERIIPRRSFERYSGAVISAKKIIKLFGEILKNKVTGSLSEFLESLKKKDSEPYPGFDEHIDILARISRYYENLQKEEGNYDPSFLIPRITKREIEEFFKKYRQILLISPTALTEFEKDIYSAVESKLLVITQNCNEYDFTTIRDWPKLDRKNTNPSSKAIKESGFEKTREKIHYSEEPSLLYEASKVLSIIQKELNTGVKPHEILVLNLDSTLAEILYDSLQSYNIPVNLSQGINIKREPLYQFFASIAEYFSDFKSSTLIKILKNPIFTKITGVKNLSAEVEALNKRIIANNLHLIYNLENEVFNDIFTRNPEIKNSLEELKQLYNSKNSRELYRNLNRVITKLGKKRSYELNVFRDAVEESVFEVSVFESEIKDKPYNIFLSILASRRLPQIGNIKGGIQILGLLETRGISFKTVIIPSFNESVFPSPSQDYRFFNSSLRRSIGLPSLYQQEELEFFYLKRLIDSSEKSYILSLISNDGSYDIPSRYIYLFGHESLKKINNEYKFPAFNKGFDTIRDLSFDTPELKSTIEKFSRLDIDRIKKCQTRYYIEKILNISEEKALSEEIDASVIGTLIHSIFYELYTKAGMSGVNQIDKEFENQLGNNLEELIDSYIKETLFFTEEINLIKEIIRKTCLNILNHDIYRVKRGFTICSDLSEEELVAKIGNKYLLKGRIDRIDKTPDGKFIIIDYKTGSIPTKKSHTEDESFKEVQLGVYGLLFREKYPERSISSLAYYDIKQAELKPLIGKEESIDAYLDNFEKHLINLLENFNESGKLLLAEDPESCKYCPFTSICRVIEI